MDNHQSQQNYSQSSKQNIDLQDSANMNQDQQALFLDVKKSKSNDSFLGKLIGTTTQMQKRPLVLNMNDFCFNKSNNIDNDPSSNHPIVNHSIFKKIKKQKKHNKCDYQKNICGYITKKIIRQFIGSTFQQFIETLCKKYYCSIQEARKFYLSKIQYITGPSHIPALITPQKKDNQQIIGEKLAFRQFFQWFLKQRYLRYLILQGKMTDKKAYIQYKNNVLFNFIEQDRVQIDKLVKKLLNQKNQQKLQQEVMRLRSLNSNRKSKLSKDKNIIITKSI